MDQTFVPEKASKLVIRVKLDADSTPSISNIQESDAEYNPVAITILATVILILAGAGYYFFSASNETDIPPEFEVNNTVAEIPAPTIAEPEIVNTAKPVGLESKAPAILPMVEVEPPVAKVEIQQKEATPDRTLETVQAVIEEKPVVTKPVIAGVVEPVTLPVLDFTANVKRAHFTHDIKDREPTDVIDGIVAAKAEGLRRVYFFTELLDLKGQTIRHQWLHEGKLKTELKFEVRGNRWRVNSSKRLNPAAMGSWQVKVVNEAGNVLVSESFEYELP